MAHTQDFGKYNAAVRYGQNLILGVNEPLTVNGTATFNGTTTAASGLAVTGNLTVSGSESSLYPVVALPAAGTTFTPTSAQSNSVFTLNQSAAITITLPAPVVGMSYDFVVQTSATGSNTLKWITNTGSVYLQGTDIIATVGGASSIFQGNGTSHISFNCNGTTTGGLVGTIVTFTCLSVTSWQVTAQNFGSGTLVTSFGTS